MKRAVFGAACAIGLGLVAAGCYPVGSTPPAHTTCLAAWDHGQLTYAGCISPPDGVLDPAPPPPEPTTTTTDPSATTGDTIVTLP